VVCENHRSWSKRIETTVALRWNSMVYREKITGVSSVSLSRSFEGPQGQRRTGTWV
jgi:hypothetical protein